LRSFRTLEAEVGTSEASDSDSSAFPNQTLNGQIKQIISIQTNKKINQNNLQQKCD
jgi:hypothetical protein